jgi:ribosomal protein L18E
MKLSLPPKLMLFWKKKERQDETQFITKIDAFLEKKRKDRMKLSLSPKLMLFWKTKGKTG